MKLWKIERTDHVDYDEYDAVIIRADTADQAVTLLFRGWQNRGFNQYEPNFTVTELTAVGEPGFVLGSFNAG